MMNQQIIISNVCEQLADISASTQNESAQRKIQDILHCIGTRHIVEQGTFYFRNRIKFTTLFRRRIPPVLQAVHFGYRNKADQIVQKRKHNQNQRFHDSPRLCFIQNVNIDISVKYRKEKNNTQNNLNPRPETGFNFPVYFKNIDPVKQLFFLQSCNYTCIILLSFPRKNNRNPITSTLLMLYFPYT